MASNADEEPLSTAEEGGNGGDTDRISTLSINQGEAEFANTSDGDNAAQDVDTAERAADVEGEAPLEEEDVILTSSSTPAEMNRALRKKCCIIIALLVVIAGLVVLVVGLVVSNKNKNSGGAGESEAIKGEYSQDVSTKNPTSASTLPPTELDPLTPEPDKLQQTLDFLINFDVSDPSTLEEAASPQYKAAVWISQMDDRFESIPSEDNMSGFMFKQRYSLAVLYYALVGESWTWNMNWLSPDHECEWYDVGGMVMLPIYYGVNCDGDPDLQDEPSDNWSKQRIVTNVELPPNNNITGTLPPEIRHLSYLKSLLIETNVDFSGSIPDQIGELEHMIQLAIVDTSLTGKIPSSLGNMKKMQYLILDTNKLRMNSDEGDLNFLKEMTALRYLVFDYNSNITGTLPDLSTLSNLEVLSVPNTGMYGELPESLSALKKLKMLYLDDCAFEGSIDVIQSMINLTHVYLEDNKFTGIIDDTFFADSKDLVHLDISNCSFSGTVPGHLFNLSMLEVLDMSINDIDGELPAEALSNIDGSNLEFLSLHSNKLSGSIPSGIGKLNNLRTLDLSLNQLSGDIPSEISNLAALGILFLGRNNYNEAPVPEWIRNMTQLTELSLKNSSFTETIPEWMGELTNLLLLDLGENDLTGTIPQTLNNLTDLVVLILNKNSLTGELGLGQLQWLEVLLIDDNSLTGNTDEICVHELEQFISDCASGSDSEGIFGAELSCSCCTLCCSDANTTCNDEEWLGNAEGIWEFSYERQRWDFDKESISPFWNYNYEQSLPDDEGVEGGDGA